MSVPPAGARHHSLAIAQFPAPMRLHHFMRQVRDVDDMGSTYDLCQDRHIPSWPAWGATPTTA
jgi:hypothetical protein